MPPASTAKSGAAGRSDRPRPAPRRTAVLIVLLAMMLLAWPLSRRFLLTPVPPRPAAGADDRALTAYYLARIKADPSDVEAHLDLGKLKEKNGLFMQAADRLQIARALGAPEAQTSGPLGRCWMKLGRTELALPELEKAARLNPESYEAALNLAQLFAETGQAAKASAILGFYLKHHPDLLDNARAEQREAVERLMVAYIGVGDVGTALKLAQQTIRLAPDKPNGYAVAGRCQLAKKQWADAALNLERAVELAPDNADLHYAYGSALKHLPGKMEQALREWQKAAEVGSHAVAYGELGAEYARRKNWRRAAIGYLRAASLIETDPALYAMASEMCGRNGQKDLQVLCRARAAALRYEYRAALVDYTTLAHSANPKMRRFGIEGAIDCFRALKDAKAFLAFVEKECRTGAADDEMRLADAYGELGDNGRRVEHLKKALAKDPNLAGHIHHEIATADVHAGRRDEAEKELELAIQIEPANPRHRHTMVGVLMDRRNVGDRLQRAIVEAEKTVELSPESAEDYHLLGTAYMAANRTPQAIQAYQHSIDLQPGYGPAYLDLGKLYARIGDKGRSEETLQLYRKYQAYDLEKQTLVTRANAHKSDPVAQLQLGDFYARANDFNHAQEQYQKALRLAPSNAAIRAKVEHLAVIVGMAQSKSGKATPE